MLFVFSLSLVYFFFLGYLVTASFKKGLYSYEGLALTLGAGILFNFLILLISQRLNYSLSIGFLFWIFGLIRFILEIPRIKETPIRLDYLGLFCLFFLLLLFSIEIVSNPTLGWDAHLIYLFHAKMIWSCGGIGQNAGWTLPYIQWSHPDYPKLFAALAAQFSFIQADWNEINPRYAILVLMLPSLLWVFSFFDKKFSFLFLVCVLIFRFSPWLWEGFMDKFMGLYGGLSLLLMVRYFEKLRAVDLYSAFCCLAIMACIKNEGTVFEICSIFSFAAFYLRYYSFSRIRQKDIKWNTLAVFFLPQLIWLYYKIVWNIHNDITGSVTFSYFLKNSANSNIWLKIMKAMLFLNHPIRDMILITIFLGLYLKLLKIKVGYPVIFMITQLILYFCGIALAYVFTPYDLSWHLATSVDRTTSTIVTGLGVITYMLLIKIESMNPISEYNPSP